MRSFLFSLITLCFSFSALLADTTVIRGKLQGFPDKELGSALALVAINDLLEDQRQVRDDIRAGGTFELSFELEQTLDVILRAGGYQFSLLLQPGDELDVSWTHVADPEGGLPADLHFSGDGAERNRHFVNMFQLYLYYPLSELEGIAPDMVENECRHCTPQEYLQYRSAKKDAEQLRLRHYIEEYDVKDELLLEWFDYFSTYRPLSDQKLFAFNYQQQHRAAPEKLQLLDDYNRYMEAAELNVPKALICTQYLKFLRRDFRMFKQVEAAKLPDFQSEKKEKGYARVLFDHMLETSTGLARSVILTHVMLDLMETSEALAQQVPPLLEDYTKTVQEARFVKAVLKKYKWRFDEKDEIRLAENINVLDLADAADESFLPSLLRRFPGKVIYIDIWSTWCGPCIREMEYYPALLEKYAGKAVEFVFVAAQSAENLWKKRVNTFNLGGYQYLLNDQQYYGLEKYVKLHGFPQHIIIDTDGEVVEQRGPQIYTPDGTLNMGLIALLDGLLAKED